MEKYFFTELNPNVTLLPLKDLVIEPIFVVEFSKMMISIIGKIKDDGSFNKSKRYSNIEKVQTWISDCSLNKAKENKLPLKSEPAQQTPAINSTDSQSITKHTIDSKTEDINAHLIELLDQASEIASIIRLQGVKQKNKTTELTCSLRDEQKKLRNTNQQLAEQLEVIAALRRKLVAAEKDVLVLKQIVIQKDAVIVKKMAEIAERIKMLDVLSRDKSKQVDETLQRMASQIGVEYRDFQDVIVAPMSCDLGENLRLQLLSIFDILEKGGMKIK